MIRKHARRSSGSVSTSNLISGRNNIHPNWGLTVVARDTCWFESFCVKCIYARWCQRLSLIGSGSNACLNFPEFSPLIVTAKSCWSVIERDFLTKSIQWKFSDHRKLSERTFQQKNLIHPMIVQESLKAFSVRTFSSASFSLPVFLPH